MPSGEHPFDGEIILNKNKNKINVGDTPGQSHEGFALDDFGAWTNAEFIF